METLRIHEVSEEILQLKLCKYNLTFDDGLYSQFFYWNLLKEIPTSKIFFIPSGAIRLVDTVRPQYTNSHPNFPTYSKAMERWFREGNREDYMTLGELNIMREEGAVIGAHGHMHIEHYDMTCFINRLEQYRKDNQDMVSWFETNLGEIPKHYCFPFNTEYRAQRAVIHVETKITEFFGKERKDVVELLRQ